MITAVSNLFGSVMVRLALIFGALATMTAAAIAISWIVFNDIATDMQSLAEERIPELQKNAGMVSVADRVRGLLSDMLIADTPEKLAQLEIKRQLVLRDLRQTAETFSGAAQAELLALVTTVESALSDLMSARQADFANMAGVATAVSEATVVAEEVIATFADGAAGAYIDLVLGSEETIAFVDNTLTTLVEQDFDLFQTALAVRAEMNLMMGAALSLTQTRDAAVASILTDLGGAASQRLAGLQEQMAGNPTTEALASRVQDARERVSPVFEGSRFAVSSTEILALRQEIDALLSTALDDIYFALAISTEDAKASNSSAITALIEDQVGKMQADYALVMSVGEVFESILKAGLSQNPEELAARETALQNAVNAARQAASESSPDVQAQLERMLVFTDPATGIAAVRSAALDAQQLTLASTDAAADSVRQIAVRAGEFASNAQSHIAASAGALTAEVARARMQMQSIGLFSLGIVVLAPLLIWLTVTRPLNRVTGVTERLAQGDLSEIEGLDNKKGEIGRMADALEIFRTGAIERIEMQEAEKRRDAEMQEAERAAERAQHEAEMRERQAQEDREREQREREAEEKAREDRLREEAEQERQARAAEQELVVRELAESLKRLSAGDLTHTIDTAFPGSYEALRMDYNAAIDTLADLIRQIGQSSGLIDSGSAEIASSSLDLSRRTENAAATLEETAAALSELTASVSSAARGAAEATETVDNVKRDAESSRKVMQDAVQAMGQIESSSSEIAKIVEVIESIAFQTNLLALNAGVEAARAGDAGRGFAVVASEVRILAHRCSDAADQINKLISESTDHVQEGVSLIDSTSEALETILRGILDMSKNVSAIAVSAQEQSNGISEINVAVEQLDRSTQQNAAMFEETTAASQSLTDEAGKLAQLVAGFRVGEAETHRPDAADETDAQVA